MAELNFKQITDKLNEEFTGDVRKLVFWYDANAEFQEDIYTLITQYIVMKRFLAKNLQLLFLLNRSVDIFIET